LVKEAIASGSPLGEAGEANFNGIGANGDSSNEKEKASSIGAEDVVIPAQQVAYDKKSSFFDNISSEIKDREDNKRGQEFRSEERKKNMETFGQGSVDNYRGGFRGRGRGRGFRGGGRGGFVPRGRGGGFRGGRGGGQQGFGAPAAAEAL